MEIETSRAAGSGDGRIRGRDTSIGRVQALTNGRPIGGTGIAVASLLRDGRTLASRGGLFRRWETGCDLPDRFGRLALPEGAAVGALRDFTACPGPGARAAFGPLRMSDDPLVTAGMIRRDFLAGKSGDTCLMQAVTDDDWALVRRLGPEAVARRLPRTELPYADAALLRPEDLGPGAEAILAEDPFEPDAGPGDAPLSGPGWSPSMGPVPPPVEPASGPVTPDGIHLFAGGCLPRLAGWLLDSLQWGDGRDGEPRCPAGDANALAGRLLPGCERPVDVRAGCMIADEHVLPLVGFLTEMTPPKGKRAGRLLALVDGHLPRVSREAANAVGLPEIEGAAWSVHLDAMVGSVNFWEGWRAL